MNKHKNRKIGLLKYTWLVAAAWTLILIGLLSLDIAKLTQATENLAIREARTHFQKDKAFRYWSSTHGGFYVPIDERTFANPYLSHIFERDIETPSGKKLTLMNPAYALRQMNEDFADTYGIFGHITSLLPLRPENSADEWETMALKSFETGESEVMEFAEYEGVRSLRLMRPLVTKEGCLKCHAHQGYEVGDIRGGTSVTIPMTDYLTQKQHTAKTHELSYALIWLLGFISIFQGSRTIKKNNFDRIEAQQLLKKSYAQLETRVKERTSELDKSNLKLQSEIDQRKQAEKAVEVEKYYSEKIINTSSTLVVGLDKNHRIRLFNKGAEKITGYTKEEVIGKDWFSIFLPSAILEELEEVWKSAWGIASHSYTNSILSSTKEEKVISWQSTGFYEDKNVDKHLLISIGEDITEREQANDALQNSEELFSGFIKSATDGIVIYDSKLNLNEINQMALAIFPKGSTRENLIGKNILEIAPSLKETGRYDKYLNVVKTGESLIFNDVIPDPQFGNRTLTLKAFKVSEGLGIIFTDVTEQKKIEKELSNYQENLEELVNERTKELDNTLRVFAGREQKINNLEERIRVLGG